MTDIEIEKELAAWKELLAKPATRRNTPTTQVGEARYTQHVGARRSDRWS